MCVLACVSTQVTRVRSSATNGHRGIPSKTKTVLLPGPGFDLKRALRQIEVGRVGDEDLAQGRGQGEPRVVFEDRAGRASSRQSSESQPVGSGSIASAAAP